MNSAAVDSGRGLAMRAVSKSFGGGKVLHEVDFSVAPGQIHGLLGQNGAGKSTLMKILGGVHSDYGGTIELDGEAAGLGTPRRAMRSGIGMIYQELSLVPELTVAESIVLGREPQRFAFDRGAVRARAAELLATAGQVLDLPLDARVADLAPGLRQRAEIAKALSRDARVLVMDEPTVRLSMPERAELFVLMKQLAAQGTAIVFISHFLEEVLEVTDLVTVLRNGRVVAHGPTADFDVRSLTLAMLDESLARDELAERPARREEGAPVIAVRSMSCRDRLHDIDLEVRSGEVLGLAGLVGSGRSRLGRVLAGAEQHSSGSIEVDGKTVRFRSPRDAIRRGVVIVPEDRKGEGVIGGQSSSSNITLTALDHGLSRFGIVRRRALQRAAAGQFEKLEVRPANADLPANAYSGGNQQKLLLGRALLAEPRVLIADQPTAGVDVGTKVQIHDILRRLADDGGAVIVITDDLDELFALSDRILVMRQGRIAAEAARAGVSRDELLDRMSGSPVKAAA